MSDESLKERLDDLAASVTIRRIEPRESPRIVDYDRDAANQAAEAFSNHPVMELFDGKMQAFVGTQRGMTPFHLVRWLGARAAEAGTEQALADLDRYAKCKEFPARQVMALRGVEVEGSFELIDSITLVPFEDLPESQQKKRITPDPTSLHGDKPTAALVKSFQHPKVHLEPGADTPDELKARSKAQDLENARLCLSLAGPCGPVMVAKWAKAAEWVPYLGGEYTGFSIQMPVSTEVTQREKLSREDVQQAATFLNKFSEAGGSTRDWLQIALERFNSAYQRSAQVDRAIDLGIAIETTFLHDINQPRELTFRIRTRAARLLGSDTSERRELYRLFGDLYRLRSIAVHEGRMSSKKRHGRTPKEVLDEGFKQLATAIRKIVDEEVSDWQVVTLE